MKLGQLKEDNMKSIFLEKLYTDCGGEAGPKTFFLKLKSDNISGSIVWHVIKFVPIVSKLKCSKIY